MPDAETTQQVTTDAKPFGDIDGGCDCHAHMIGYDPRFPLSSSRAEDPEQGSLHYWLDQYRTHLRSLGLSRGVIVHSMLYGLDNSITAEAIRQLGQTNFRAIGLVDNEVSEAQLDKMAQDGFKGVRLNYVHGGTLDWRGTQALAPRLRARGMHVQILLHSHKHMTEIAPALKQLECDTAIDHMGWPDMAAGPNEAGFSQLLSLLADDCVWLKLSGVYRFSESPFSEADSFVRAALAVNPTRCIWGSDWPFIMLGGANQPRVPDLSAALLRAIPEHKLQQAILQTNPTELFSF